MSNSDGLDPKTRSQLHPAVVAAIIAALATILNAVLGIWAGSSSTKAKESSDVAEAMATRLAAAAESLDRAIPVGSVLSFAGDATGSSPLLVENGGNWMLCDGRPLSRTDNTALWEAIQTAHGGGYDEAGNRVPGTDFNLPDYRGIFLRGVELRSSLNGSEWGDPDATLRVSARFDGNAGRSVGSRSLDSTRLPRTSEFVARGGNRVHPLSGAKVNVTEVDDGMMNVAAFDRSVYSGSTQEGKGHEHTIYGGDRQTSPVNAYVIYLIRAR